MWPLRELPLLNVLNKENTVVLTLGEFLSHYVKYVFNSLVAVLADLGRLRAMYQHHVPDDLLLAGAEIDALPAGVSAAVLLLALLQRPVAVRHPRGRGGGALPAVRIEEHQGSCLGGGQLLLVQLLVSRMRVLVFRRDVAAEGATAGVTEIRGRFFS